MATIAETAEYAALPDDQKGHLTSLGFDKLDPMVAVVSAAGKLASFGPNADELIRLPKDASGDALAPLYERLGVPKDAAGYQFDATVPADVAERARAVAAELRLTPSQASAYVQRSIADAKKAADDGAAQSVAAVTAAKGELASAWGAEAGMKEFLASKALETFGWTVDDVAKMAGSSKDAYVRIMQNMASLGGNMREARLVTGDPAGGVGNMTPEQAQAKISSLMSDPSFLAKYQHDEKRIRDGAIEELQNLQSIVVRARMAPR